ncbi:heptaprenylglyceryl phosphate synthase [Fervidibacillus halotolerans]|uniref:Heptaprenylglyceryl phosphate synthase n=1 Tax=Fervidibacillus halotolerans TaxID=2980027 RepID=A0A9E8RYT5_9BACI|nr:heptaprenylglyceryl phosphate synthase [Fervidibacillus halotolerans]WAA12603.1 heptaprenylglyceryl phosphate synthase [Fervidibacillus halotolerans]
MYDYREWKHIFKLDPNKELSDEQLEKICESGTDAIMVGGTDGVTLDQVLHLLSRIRKYAVPCVLEISSLETITPGFDLYFIPTVLNTNEAKWILKEHHRAIKEYAHYVDWREIVTEGYCILNGESKVAQLTGAQTDLYEEDVVAYALLAEKLFRLPIFYLEYSGTYGNPQLVKKVKDVLDETVLFYGGGISTVEQAVEMKRLADVIIVGNSIYDHFEEALKTVQAVKALK